MNVKIKGKVYRTEMMYVALIRHMEILERYPASLKNPTGLAKKSNIQSLNPFLSIINIKIIIANCIYGIY